MINSAEAVAREMADEVASSAVYHLNQMYPRWRKDEVKTMPISLRGHLSNAITSALTTFAAQQVQVTWEEAARLAEQETLEGEWDNDFDPKIHRFAADVAKRCRRRAQEGRG